MAAVGLTRTGVLPPPLADLLRASAARTALTGQPDLEALAGLRRCGMLATAVPAEYGGGGQDAFAVNKVVEELARVNPSAAIIAFQHFAVCMRMAEWGTRAQKASLLPALAAGDLLAASAWSEPGVGAAKKKINTVASPVPGRGWLLNGEKSFATSAGIADIYLILAQTSDIDDPGSRYGSSGQSFFLVPAGNPGLVPERPLDLVGMRGSATGHVSLHDCQVSDSGRLGPTGHAAVIIAGVRESGMTLGAVSVGIARALLGIAAAHADRQESVKQTMNRHWLAELSTQVSAAGALVSQAGQRSSADPGRITIQSKLFASAVAEHVGAEVARMVGSAGYLAGHEINRLIADARAVAHMGPVNDLCRELIAAPPDAGKAPDERWASAPEKGGTNA
jgi:alkylation response protein AidB-like acyl-CoA dehydrogenase